LTVQNPYIELRQERTKEALNILNLWWQELGTQKPNGLKLCLSLFLWG